jgi:hypothetical protein
MLRRAFSAIRPASIHLLLAHAPPSRMAQLRPAAALAASMLRSERGQRTHRACRWRGIAFATTSHRYAASLISWAMMYPFSRAHRIAAFRAS